METHFVEQSICVNFDVTYDASFGESLFRDMLVHERGGKSIESLSKAYFDSFDQEEIVGI